MSASSNLVDRAAAYGDGLFETVAIRGGKARFWPAHVERLQTSCARLGLAAPSTDFLTEALSAKLLAADCSVEFATARIVVSAAKSRRGYLRTKNAENLVDISIFSSAPLPQVQVVDGVAVRVCAMRLAVQPALAGIKSLNRLEQVLARNEWDDDIHFEGLMLDTDGRLICGTMSNVYAVIDSTVVSPAITRCGVSGVMRAQVLRLLAETGADHAVRDLTLQDLATATEVFLSNSQFGVLPVNSIDDRRLAVGNTTREVQRLLVANGVAECAP